jgi:hypothetical protein
MMHDSGRLAIRATDQPLVKVITVSTRRRFEGMTAPVALVELRWLLPGAPEVTPIHESVMETTVGADEVSETRITYRLTIKTGELIGMTVNAARRPEGIEYTLINDGRVTPTLMTLSWTSPSES